MGWKDSTSLGQPECWFICPSRCLLWMIEWIEFDAWDMVMKEKGIVCPLLAWGIL